MKKQIILLATLLMTGVAVKAQVGVGTEDPKATFEVVGETTASVADGVLVPRFTVAELSAKDAAYAADQNGALVFVTSGTGSTGKTSDITGPGFHYYDNATSKWKTMGGGGSATITHNVFTRAGASYNALVPADLTQLLNTLHITTSAPGGGLTLPNLTAADMGKVLFIYNSTGGNWSINFTDANGAPQTNTLINGRGVTFISFGAAGWVRASY